MADTKISALPASTTPLAGTEVLPIVQGGVTKQVSVANLTAGRAVSALSLTSTNGATIQGLTVGLGAGAVAQNTAVGLLALAGSNTGTTLTALGYGTLNSNTSGVSSTAAGHSALVANTTGGRLTAVGVSALGANTTSDNSTAVGYLAGTASTGAGNQLFGYSSGSAVTTGAKNVILGSYTGSAAPISATGSNFVVLSDGDGNIVASTKTANTFALPGGTMSSGTGIAFPATQSASTDANTLDDYEEGTWTPADGSGASLGFTSVSGNYTKIGRMVTAICSFTYPSTADTSFAIISGLPFTLNAGASTNSVLIGYKNGAATAAFMIGLGGTATFRPVNSAGSAITNAACSLGVFNIQLTYFV